MNLQDLHEDVNKDCTMCEKPMSGKVFLYDGEIYCSMECIEENYEFIKGFNKEDVKVIDL